MWRYFIIHNPRCMSDIDFNEPILNDDLAKSGYSQFFGEATYRQSMGRSSFGFERDSETESISLDEQGRMSQGLGAIKLKPVKLDRNKVKKAVHIASSPLEQSATTAETVQSRPFTLRPLRQDEEFSCKSCSRGGGLCGLCHGRRKLRAQDNLVRFLEYVVGFKAGVVPSYSGGESKKRLSVGGKTIINNFCNDFFGGRESIGSMRQSVRASQSQRRSQLSVTCRKSKAQVVSELNKMVTVHARFRCDECDCHPIVGIRWHCNQCPDYDICGQCKGSTQHPHILTSIDKCHAKGKQLQSMIHFIAQPRHEPSLRPPPSILTLPPNPPPASSIIKSSIR